MKKVLAAAALAAVSTSALGGCAAITGEEGVIDYWLWDANQLPGYRQCAEDFNEANPDLTVRITQDAAEYWSEIDELPGCFASGRTLSELHEAIGEAVGLYLWDGPGQVKPAEPKGLKAAGITYLHLPVEDFHPRPTVEQLTKAFEFYKSAPDGVTTLVHCGAGYGRSGTCVSAIQLFVTSGKAPEEGAWKAENFVEKEEQVAVLREIRDLCLKGNRS